MSVLFIVFAAVVVLGPLIALHEYGHFWVARKLGVKVLTYSIGFGPAVWQRQGKDGVDYRISAIPLGGYVRMLDEREAEVAENEKHLAFNNQKPWKKIAIVAAGPLMNFLIAIVLFWLLLLPASEQLNTRIAEIQAGSAAEVAGLQVGDRLAAIGGDDIDTWKEANYRLLDYIGETTQIPIRVVRDEQPLEVNLSVTNFLNEKAQQAEGAFTTLGFEPYTPHVPALIAVIQNGGAAQRQGMQVGDKVLSINDKPVADWYAMTDIVRQNPEKLLAFTVLRQGKPVQLDIIPQREKDNMGDAFGRIGVKPDTSNITIPDEYKQIISHNPVSALAKAGEQTWDLSVMTLTAMGKMLSGLIGLENLSGPITIAKISGDVLSIGWKPLLSFMALMSVSLGVLNLLPIPVLDGGHLLYYFYELVTGKPLPENVQMIGLNIGLVLMLGLMLLAVGNDIARLF